MARYAIGDVQGCHDALQALLQELHFSPDRDQLFFVGDLVNRGAGSLEVLRLVRHLGAAAHTVLGNHDLHLLALHFRTGRGQRPGDTLDAVLAAPDREALMQWLMAQPLVIDDAKHGDLFLHGGVVPEWTLEDVLAQAAAASSALLADPVFSSPACTATSPSAGARHTRRWRNTASPSMCSRACVIATPTDAST